MRKIVMMMSVSLDGFFESSARELGWHLVDEELHTHFNEVLGAMSMFLDGRVTYEMMAGYWPTADQDPDAAAPVAEFARIWREMPKIVYSRTLEHASHNTTICDAVDIREINALKSQPDGGDLAIGGANLGSTFTRLGLIDEYRLYVHPVVLGRGRPLFGPDSRLDLSLTETRTFGNGVVLLRYTQPLRSDPLG